MKISRLEIKNALAITEFELTPGKITLIQGENESGKTSILEGIERAVYNKNRRIDFVRKGEKEATLYVGLDDGTKIDKRVTVEGETRGTVSRDGVNIPKPETYLRSITGEFSFNPIDFINKTGKEQAEILLALIPIRITEAQIKEWTGEVPPVNLDRHAIEVLEYLSEKYFYDKRTTANANLKDIKNQIEALDEQLPDNYDPAEWRGIDLYSLHEKVRNAQEFNNKIDEANLFIEEFDERKKDLNQKYDLSIKNRIEEDAGRIKEIEDMMAKLKLELADIKGKQSEAIKTIEINRKEALDNRDKVLVEKAEFVRNAKKLPVADLLAEAKNTEEMKAFINTSDNIVRLKKEESAAEEEAIRLDNVVNLLRKKPAELLSKVKLPVKGLGINDKMQVTIDDLPIANLSTSRQITLAIEIARATTGKLESICIDRFETLDKEHQELFYKEIAKDKFQYFITEVTEGPLKVTQI